MCVLAIPAVAAAVSGATGISAATLATISTVSSIAGTAFSVIGGLQQGKAQQAAYNYQAAVDRNNSLISKRQADDAIARGKVEEDQLRLKVNQVKGSQRAAFASTGVDLGSEVVSDTLADTAATGELDALTIRSNAAREAYGYKVHGMNYDASAKGNVLAGKNAVSASKTNAFTTILGGASTVSDKWATYKKEGIFK